MSRAARLLVMGVLRGQKPPEEEVEHECTCEKCKEKGKCKGPKGSTQHHTCPHCGHDQEVQIPS